MSGPIIISGCGRSGTTFCQHLLSAHSQIAIAGQEPGDLDLVQFVGWHERFAERGRQMAAGEPMNPPHYIRCSDDEALRIAATSWESFCRASLPRRPVWGWKSVWSASNPAFVQLVDQIWPSAQWVICVRHPRDALESALGTFAPDLTVSEFVNRWTACARFSRERGCPILQLDRPYYARDQAQAIFRQLGESPDHLTNAFLARWPRIHHRRKRAKVADRDWSRAVQDDPSFSDLALIFGYNVFG